MTRDVKGERNENFCTAVQFLYMHFTLLTTTSCRRSSRLHYVRLPRFQEEGKRPTYGFRLVGLSLSFIPGRRRAVGWMVGG